MRVEWTVIRDAWEPHMGPEIASERARNAAQAIRLHGKEPHRDRVVDTLTRCFVSAQFSIYGGLTVSGSTIIDAVNDVMDLIWKETE